MRYEPTPFEEHIKKQIAFAKARLAQYMERTHQSRDEAIAQIMKIYGAAQDQQAVNDLVDPVVDPELQSATWERIKDEFLTSMKLK